MIDLGRDKLIRIGIYLMKDTILLKMLSVSTRKGTKADSMIMKVYTEFIWFLPEKGVLDGT
jgi:hypothetical protein